MGLGCMSMSQDRSTGRVTAERRAMLQEPCVLDEAERAVVLSAIVRHCVYRAWNLLAAHVRSNHVHVVVEAAVPPERAMTEFKAYASRELNGLPTERADRKRWARHGSTRWRWSDEDVQRAVAYVVEEQGVPTALFVAEGLGDRSLAVAAR
jgi:REP element-mobilizing transposase RayT